MALNKQTLSINFAGGLDTKSDPFQVPPGKFLALQNSIFTKQGLLQKRNGYGALSSLPDTSSTYLTTFNGNLTAIGTSLNALSSSSGNWINKGIYTPVQLETLPLVRSTTQQSQSDTAIAPNGLICTVYTDNITSGSTTVPSYKYVIADSVTGQNIINPTVIPVTIGTVVGSPIVFTLGSYFIIVFTNHILASYHMQYIAISITDPTTSTLNTEIASTATIPPVSGRAFDGVVANNSLYLAWNGNDGGGAIRLTRIDSTLVQHNTVVFSGHSANIISVSSDNAGPTPVIYTSFYDSGTTNGYTFIVNQNLLTILGQTQIISGEPVINITSVATGMVGTIVYEVDATYSYDSTIHTHFIKKRTITQAGVLGTASVVVRSVGLASEAFFSSGTIYFLGVYNSPFQPSYFLLNLNGQVVSTLSYSNGGSYYTAGLPAVTTNGTIAQLSYLRKDSVEAVNKTQGAPNSAGIFSQIGINLATFNISASNIASTEIGSDLNISGGFLWMYDGIRPVENGFFLWPDYVEATSTTTGGAMPPQLYYYVATYEWADNNGNVFRSAPSVPVSADLTSTSPTPITFTSTFSSNVSTITVSSIAGLKVGQFITDVTTPASIQANTKITAINGLVLTLSLPTGGNSAGGGDTLQTVDSSSVTVNVPTLRLTYKIPNPVKIVLYRWSLAQQTYYQVTSISAPILNDTTVDSLSFVDTQSDSSIIGNNILYTTGGVLENIPAPANSIMTLFQSRLFLVDSEDRNLLWFSKQVIENTPVEMSDLLTIYIAPTTAVQGSTGPITALASLDDKLIVFKKDAIYYINGTGPDNTGANSQFSEPIFITSTVGCPYPKSIVFMPHGLMFQSDKGIWLLGRDLSTNYIGAPVESFTQDSLVQSVVAVPGTNQVRFTMSTNITLMFDYYYGQWGTFINVPAISSTIYEDLHTYIKSSGQVFQETPGTYLDATNPVLMSFTTSWMNLAGLQGFERFYSMFLLGQYITPFRLAVKFAFDFNPNPSEEIYVTPDNFTKPWGGEQLWGTGTAWGGPGSKFEARIFPQEQKVESFQIIIDELYDSSFGVQAGAGLTLSGMNLVVGMKKGYRTSNANRNFG